MQFIYSTFLFALAALAIPIIIHLFHFRRIRTVYFTNVKFLKAVKDESSQRRKLRDLLVLIARCLAVAMLVFAFAQPFIPKGGDVKKGNHAVSIYLDNSFSMNAQSRDVSLLEKAKQKAREIVQAYTPDDRIQILTNDFEGRHQRLVTKEEALTYIDEIKTTPSVQSLSQVIARQKQTLNLGKMPHKTAFILSDFQQNITDLSTFRDSTLDVNLVPLAAVQEKNIAIDSAWFEAPVQILGQINPLVVKITNYSPENVENVKVVLKIDGQEKPVGLVNLKANETREDTVPVTILRTGWHAAEVILTDYPVQFDDSYYFTFNVPQTINVLSISDGAPNRFLQTAFSSLRNFRFSTQSTGTLQYAQFTQNQLIILDNISQVTSGLAAELGQYLNNGGNIVLFAPANANDFLNNIQANGLGSLENTPREVSAINTDEFVFKDVFANQGANLKLPSSISNYRIQNRNGEALLTYRDGSAFLTKNRIGQGNLYLCATPLDEKYSNLTRSGDIFVPMLYKMAISSAKEWKIGYTIGKDDFLEVDSKGIVGETAYKMRGKAEEFIPEQRIVTGKAVLGVRETVRDAGHFDLFTRPDSVLYKFGFNFDRRESVLTYFDAASLKKLETASLKVFDETAEANFTALVGERNQGISLWRLCIILALLFLAAEVLLLRFFKVN